MYRPTNRGVEVEPMTFTPLCGESVRNMAPALNTLENDAIRVCSGVKMRFVSQRGGKSGPMHVHSGFSSSSVK